MTHARFAIEVRDLRKAYRPKLLRPGVQALDGLELVVAAGGRVHGFVGPNGSGKTTTLRILLGLVRPDGGQITVLGHAVPHELSSVAGSIGSLVESPTLFPAFSGRQNLALLARVGGLPLSRVDEVLEQVGLGSRAKDRVDGYSLGMRQRLGLASALLKGPSLLLLDEPTNGLDPAGLRDTRDLLRALAAAGTTVLLASHLLSEVQAVCDDVTIVSEGRTLASGPVGQVAGYLPGSRPVGGRYVVGLAPEDLEVAEAVLRGAGLEVERLPGRLVVGGARDPGSLTRLLASSGIYLCELTRAEPALEDVFLALTRGGLPQGREAPTP